MSHKSFLIVGGDSFLGKHTAAALTNAGKEVVTTSRKKENLSKSKRYLDLSKDTSGWDIPENVDIAILFAAVTSLEECRKYPRESNRVNVDGTVSLAANLADRGIPIVYPSTNLVFDGQHPYMKTDQPTNPRVEYGRQKALVEQRLMTLDTKVFIIRFTKILSARTPLVRRWSKELNDKKVINPFSDMVLAPLSVDFAVNVIMAIVEKQRPGIWHVSADQDITYEQLARLMARKLDVSQRFVQPIRTGDSGLDFEWIPRHSTLDASGLEYELGISVPSINETVTSLFQ